MNDRAMDALASLVLILFYVAPLALIFLGVRWMRRRIEARRNGASMKPRQAALGMQTDVPAASAEPAGYRIDMGALYGSWAMFGACLLIAFLARDRWWGYIGQGLYVVLLAAVYASAFSRSAYETERKNKYAALARADYVQVTLLFFALLPTLAWLGLMLPTLAHNLRGTR